MTSRKPSSPARRARKSAAPAYRNPALSAEKRMKDLLSRMTLEEKAAQMLCVWQQKPQTLLDAEGKLDLGKAKKSFKDGHGLGQVGRPSDAGNGLTARQMAETTNAIQKFFIENTRLGIPVIFHEECLHGHAAVGGTSFPQPIALGGTFNPELVESLYTMTAEEARQAGMNSQMFNSFLDGTKSAIEMAAVANACDLAVPQDGLLFPPCGADALATVLRPKELAGVLERDGMVEVVSSLERDGSPVPRDLRWGVYVVLKAANDYAAVCFKQYGLPSDSTGRYAAMYKPFHLIGLELSISVLNAALRREPTGSCRAWRGDAVAVAKRALQAGEMLDGEGGYTVYAKLIPATRSLERGALPIGLAHHVKLTRDVAAGEILTAADVTLDSSVEAVCVRREMEREALTSRAAVAAE